MCLGGTAQADAHRNHGAEDFRGGLVMRRPQILVFPSPASKKSLLVPWGRLPQPGFCGHEDTGAESGVPPPRSSASHAVLYRVPVL